VSDNRSASGVVNKVVDEINERNEKKCEDRVRQLVERIVNSEAEIRHLQQKIADDKAELKKLELPEPVKLEL